MRDVYAALGGIGVGIILTLMCVAVVAVVRLFEVTGRPVDRPWAYGDMPHDPHEAVVDIAFCRTLDICQKINGTNTIAPETPLKMAPPSKASVPSVSQYQEERLDE